MLYVVSNDIPVISLDGIDGNKSGEICKKIVEACEDWGIFQVDHGVDAKLISDMTRLARHFFALTPEEKLKIDISGGKKGGFIVSSHLQVDTAFINFIIIQIKFTIARRLDRSNKRIQRRIHGTGVQASRSSIRGNGIRETQKEAFSKACVDMDQKIVVSYYPKRPQPDLTLGLKHHMDPGTITLPLQDQVGGLHATRVNGKTWITVQPVEGAFVVNLGDHGHQELDIALEEKHDNMDDKEWIKTNRQACDLVILDEKFEDEDKALLLLNSLPDEYGYLTTTLLHGKDSVTFDTKWNFKNSSWCTDGDERHKKKLLVLFQGSTIIGSTSTVSRKDADSAATKLWHMRLGHTDEKASIVRHFNVQDISQQNGVAECMNQTILEKVWCILSNAGLGKKFWAKAVEYACHLTNHLPSAAIEGKTPIEMWSGKAAIDYYSLHIFGSTAYYHVKELRLDQRAKKALFMGITGGLKGYRF
ncbi:naringenin,2-oxoglutarate 3-dioxygenase [Citrus sinensis]|nr:naringenin,2-oxoglutarate 3-dioxygenase [Citrus sinensis]